MRWTLGHTLYTGHRCIDLRHFNIDELFPSGYTLFGFEICNVHLLFPSLLVVYQLCWRDSELPYAENQSFLSIIEQCYTSIKDIFLCNSCDSLKSFPLGLYPKIFSFEIDGCKNFDTFSMLNKLDQLRDIRIISCPNLVYFLVGRLIAPNLTRFDICKCMNLKSLYSSFLFLYSLSVRDCPKLECLAEGCFLSNFQELCISNYQKLMAHRNDRGETPFSLVV